MLFFLQSDSFDRRGVELGKVLAMRIQDPLIGLHDGKFSREAAAGP
ncbi:hypothetical protein JQ615_31875 [Bradyrhizobium jicamae]|uniref:Uncharacterized protein n=1 Tax=Bradyrhizobium jicamae TaxID=280332 RepID=A0ABS5FTB0_9BRAD|nr:hypothetical protein [Bradyrhizobium jicamae]MBR0799975.1 hypothetical protein [Bradyrhizobium jicamae]